MSDEKRADPIDLNRLAEIIGDDDRSVLQDLLSFFVETFPDVQQPLVAALNNQDATALSDAAHAAKSAATNAAAFDLTETLQTLEIDAVNADWAHLAAGVDEVGVEFEAIVQYVDRLREEA